MSKDTSESHSEFIRKASEDSISRMTTRILSSTPSNISLASFQGIEFILETFADLKVNDTDIAGNSLLHLAAREGNVEAAKYLLDKGADINARNSEGDNPFHFASWEGHDEIVLLLLGKGANIDDEDTKKYAALHLAALDGHESTVRLLISRGANINARNSEGYTPLKIAADKGHVDVVKALIENGADVNLATLKGETSLTMAAHKGYTEIVRLLLENGADVNSANLVEKYTPLHGAILGEQEDIVELILSYKPNLSLKDREGDTPLSMAVSKSLVRSVRRLLEEGSNVHERDNKGSTALCLAGLAGNLEIISSLLEYGALPNEDVDNDGRGALFWAATSGHIEVAKKLIECGADINIRDKDGGTPLNAAVYGGHLDFAAFLLDNGAKIDSRDKNGHTILQVSASYGQLSELSFLTDRGVEINEKDKEGKTALYWAAERGHLNAVEFLLSKGADYSPKSKEAKVLLRCAIKNASIKLILDLVKSGLDVTTENFNALFKLVISSNFDKIERSEESSELFSQVLKRSLRLSDEDKIKEYGKRILEHLQNQTSVSREQKAELSREFFNKMVKVSPVKAIDLAKRLGEDKDGLLPKLASGILALKRKVEDIDKYVVLYKAFEESAVKLDFALLERSYKDLILVLRNIDPALMDADTQRKIEIYNNLRKEGDKIKVFAKEIVAAKDEFARELNNAKTKKDKSKAKAGLEEKIARFQQLRERIEKDLVNQRIKNSLSQDIEEKLGGIYDLLIKSGGYGAELIRGEIFSSIREEREFLKKTEERAVEIARREESIGITEEGLCQFALLYKKSKTHEKCEKVLEEIGYAEFNKDIKYSKALEKALNESDPRSVSYIKKAYKLEVPADIIVCFIDKLDTAISRNFIETLSNYLGEDDKTTLTFRSLGTSIVGAIGGGAGGGGAAGGAKALDAVGEGAEEDEDDDRGLDDIDLDEEDEDFTAEMAAGTETEAGTAAGGGGRIGGGGGGGGAGISLPDALSSAHRKTLHKIYVKGEIKNIYDIRNLVEAFGRDNFTFEMTDAGFKIRDYTGKIKGGHKPHGENSSVDKSCLKDIKELFESHGVFEHFGITSAIDSEETSIIWRGGAEESSKEPEDGDDALYVASDAGVAAGGSGASAAGSCAADFALLGHSPVPDDV